MAGMDRDERAQVDFSYMKSVLYVTHKRQDYLLMEANKNLLIYKTPIPYIPTSSVVNGHGINEFLQKYSNYTVLEKFLG